MSTNEVFMIPDNRGGQNSFDPNLLLASMMNGNNGFGGNGSWMWVIFLFFLYPLMRNGGTFGTASFAPNGTVTLKVKVDNNVIDYPEIPRNSSVMSYNNGATIVCETKQGLITELENTLQQTKQILAERPKYEQIVSDCESLLKEINPVFAKDKERDDRINSLDTKVTSMEGKLDKILNVLSTNSNPNIKL